MTSATRVSVMRRLIVAVLLLAAAGVVHTSADRDDDFAEFDYDLDDEEGEGKYSFWCTPQGGYTLLTAVACSAVAFGCCYERDWVEGSEQFEAG